MKDIVIIGAGGFGREVAQLILDINQDKKTWNLLGFVDETLEKQGTVINNHAVLGDFSWLLNHPKLWCVCAIGNPKDKYKLVNKALNYDTNFTNLIHPDARLSKFSDIGIGSIICCNSFISVNTKIGSHVSINPYCGIGHDAIIEDYASLYWNVIISGNVHIQKGCEIGSKADVLPKKTIGMWSVIGAGAVVTKDIPPQCTAVGVPAKLFRV